MMYIAVVAYSYKLSCDACKVLAQADEDSTVFRREQGRISMKDGSVYQAIANAMELRGKRYTQLIIVDDNRWEVLTERSELISYLIQSNGLNNFDWQVQKYEW